MENSKARKEIIEEWKRHRFADYVSYPSLKALGVDADCLGYEDCDFDELSFAVPEKWLYDTCIDVFDNLKLPCDVQYWLENEYTSDDSIIIFERAMEENQIVMINFN